MSRSKIEELSNRFAQLHSDRRALVLSCDETALFACRGTENALWPASAATVLAKSASVVEQMINGITVRLWDDPFEWTLPENFRTAADLTAYFDEVEHARQGGFQFFKDDREIERSIPAPVKLTPIDLLLEQTLTHSDACIREAEQMLSINRSNEKSNDDVH